MDEANLLWSVLFGRIGIGFFSYGRKQESTIPLLTGVALFIFPYFISNTTMLIIIGIILVFIPYLTRYF